MEGSIFVQLVLSCLIRAIFAVALQLHYGEDIRCISTDLAFVYFIGFFIEFEWNLIVLVKTLMVDFPEFVDLINLVNQNVDLFILPF